MYINKVLARLCEHLAEGKSLPELAAIVDLQDPITGDTLLHAVMHQLKYKAELTQPLENLKTLADQLLKSGARINIPNQSGETVEDILNSETTLAPYLKAVKSPTLVAGIMSLWSLYGADPVRGNKQILISNALKEFDPNVYEPTKTLQALAALIQKNSTQRKLIRTPVQKMDYRLPGDDDFDTEAYKLICKVFSAFKITVPDQGFVDPKQITVATRTLADITDSHIVGDTLYNDDELTALDNLGAYAGLGQRYFTRLAISDDPYLFIPSLTCFNN